MFKTPLLCDRRVYSFKGFWKSPNNDIAEPIFYFVKEPLTMIPSYVNGREQFRETITIAVFGSKPICKEDLITLDNGTQYKVFNITQHFFESNIAIRDMLKPRVESLELVLE